MKEMDMKHSRKMREHQALRHYALF